MFEAMMRFMPLRAMAAFNPEKFTEDMLNSLIKQLNDIVENSTKAQTIGS